MKAKIMDTGHLLVILSQTEVLRLGLNHNMARMPTALCKMTLAKLFLEGCRHTGFAYRNAHDITIRTFSVRDGTLALLFCVQSSSKLSSTPRRRFRIKQTTGPYIYRFACCTDLLNAAEQLVKTGISCPGATLLRVGMQYDVIFPLHRKMRRRAQALLAEYGVLRGKGRIAAAAAQEHGEWLSNDLLNSISGIKP